VPAGPGLRELPVGGDLIIAVDSVPLIGLAGSFAELDRHDHGEKSTLRIVRKDVEQELPIALAAWREPVHHISGRGPQRFGWICDFPVSFYPAASFPDIFPEKP